MTHQEYLEKITELKRLLASGENTAENLDALKGLLSNNLLLYAIRHGDTEIMAKFLQSEIITQNPDLLKKTLSTKDDFGCNVFYHAAKDENTEAVKAFLKSPILLRDSELSKELLSNKDRYGRNAFVSAAGLGKLEVVTELLEHDYHQDSIFRINFLSNKDKNGRNALASAAFGRANDKVPRNKVVTALLEHGSQDPDLLKMLLSDKDKGGLNALGLAVFNGNTEIVKTLLEHNYSDPTLLGKLLKNEDNEGRNVLASAAFLGNTEIVKTLLEHNYSDPTLLGKLLNHQDSEGRNVIKHAVMGNKVDIVELLLQKGSIIDTIKPTKPIERNDASEMCKNSKNTAKEIIDKIKKHPINIQEISELLGSLGEQELKRSINVSLYVTNNLFSENQHRTPLQVAAELGNVEVMRLLIEKGAEVNVVNNKGRTALDYATKYGKKDAVSFLEDANSIPSSSISVAFTTNPVHEGKGKEGGGSKLP